MREKSERARVFINTAATEMDELQLPLLLLLRVRLSIQLVACSETL